MHTASTAIAGRRSMRELAIRAVFAAGCALFVCGCNTDQRAVANSPDTPADYRERHPITLKESDHTLELLVGSNRGELNPTQRAQVLSFGLNWKHEATGGVIVNRPVGSTNERAAADSMREILSILAASGIPLQSIVMETYPANGPALAAVRISYPRVTAQAGPCGLWPRDIGPTFNRDYFENQPYWNYGCATQRNLAAMVDNPADLVQPRGETASYTPRRTTVMEKYRSGNPTSTQSNSDGSKISDLGK
jgi:pilus assembly protein CpaD